MPRSERVPIEICYARVSTDDHARVLQRGLEEGRMQNSMMEFSNAGGREELCAAACGLGRGRKALVIEAAMNQQVR